MKATLSQLAEIVGGKISGNGKTTVTGFAGIKEAGKGDITFISNNKYINCVSETKAAAVIISITVKSKLCLPAIRVKNPDLAFAKIVGYFSKHNACLPTGIHLSAIMGKNVKIGKDVSIQPNVVIEEGASVGNNTTLYPNVYIGHKAKLGKNCLIYPNVTIREGCILGNNVIIHSGSVIGSDGFGYTKIGEKYYKIPQTGIVVIEDDVEIGANVTIDRGRFDKTVIGKGTKIDNLVHIAHNVKIGANSILVAQVGISGSSSLGKNNTLAGQVGVVGHVSIGDNVTIGARSVVTKNIPSGCMVSGFPAQSHKKQLHQDAIIRKLPEIYKKLKNIKS